MRRRGGATRLVVVYASEARTAATGLAVARGGLIGGGSGSKGVCHCGTAAAGAVAQRMVRSPVACGGYPAGGTVVVVPMRWQRFRRQWSIGASTVDKQAVDWGGGVKTQPGFGRAGNDGA